MATNYRDLSGNNRVGVDLHVDTDRSGSITLGGTAQNIVSNNGHRKSLVVQNISAETMWINENGTAAADTAGSYKLAAGDAVQITSPGPVSIVAATTGSKFTATEM